MTRFELMGILAAFQERCAYECDKEKGFAEERLAEDNRNLRRTQEHAAAHRGQRAAAFWCAKHVREIDREDWFRSIFPIWNEKL